MTNKLKLSLTAMAILLPSAVFAQDAPSAVPTDTVWILNSLLFLFGGVLVFWMAAGFAMLEAGLVRSKNVTMQLTKNVALFSFRRDLLLPDRLQPDVPAWRLGHRRCAFRSVPRRGRS